MRKAFFLAVLLAAGCARSEDASVVADRNEMQAVEQVRTPEQDDDDLALGEWRETLQEDLPALEFGPRGAPPLFSLRCDERGGVLLQRHGTVPVGDLPMMLVTIGSETRRLAVTTAGGAVPMLRAALTPSDPFIVTLSRATTPIVIRIGDSPPLALPPAPSIAAFVTRCARNAAAPPTDADGNVAAEANAAAPAAAAPDQR